MQGQGLWITSAYYGPVLTQAHGQPLPQVVGCFTVQGGDVFLASPAPRSLDGRYFGSVQIRSLTAQAVPLVTW